MFVYTDIHTHKWNILLKYKKEWNNAICNYTDGARDYLKSDKDKYHRTCRILKKNKEDTNQFIYKTEKDSQTQKKKIMVTKEKGGSDKLALPYIHYYI